MKIKEGFTLCEMGEAKIVVPVGDASFSLNGVIKLNESGVLLWNKLVNQADESELIETLVSNYNIPKDIATTDVSAFLDSLKSVNCIEE